ncbi:hypothetical protein [Burkholderia sp. BCC1047]|uniref:hypothetical protein n=1 Tax=Burkholderia sp. BCC1047 TaxID=2676299 RepID=UPI001FC7D23C|nr:hypothetical protein [Burkholderia sp. BCC1047]
MNKQELIDAVAAGAGVSKTDASKSALKRSREVALGFFDSLGLRYEIDDSARRGLSYYLNGRGFEIRCTELGAQQQVVGGGAYQEGAGFGIGAERLLLAMTTQGLA